jgi:hypothetical protein
MGFTGEDAAALNAARDAGFNPSRRDSADMDWPIETFDCPDAPACAAPGRLLADAIAAAHRFTENTTVWLTVANPTVIPKYVHEALRHLQGFGARTVVIQAGGCTHGPDATVLNPFLQADLEKANGASHAWHPFADRRVWTYGQPKDAA